MRRRIAVAAQSAFIQLAPFLLGWLVVTAAAIPLGSRRTVVLAVGPTVACAEIARRTLRAARALRPTADQEETGPTAPHGVYHRVFDASQVKYSTAFLIGVSALSTLDGPGPMYATVGAAVAAGVYLFGLLRRDVVEILPNGVFYDVRLFNKSLSRYAFLWHAASMKVAADYSEAELVNEDMAIVLNGTEFIDQVALFCALDRARAKRV